MVCRICKGHVKNFSYAKLMNKYDVGYFFCSDCGFVQTEEPYWLSEAYSESINITDTGILRRNNMLSSFTSIIILFFFKKDNKFLDYAGGYGIFVRLMRDVGFDFYWYDKYTNNLLARGFEGEIEDKYELVTAFESFEHFDNPLKEFENLMQMSNNILLSTTLIKEEAPLLDKWEYYGLEHGQHISFYSKKTMQYIANKYNLNFYTNGKNIHLFTTKKLTNINFKFLYVLSRLGANKIISMLMKSKTLSDYQVLRKKVY